MRSFTALLARGLAPLALCAALAGVARAGGGPTPLYLIEGTRSTDNATVVGELSHRLFDPTCVVELGLRGALGGNVLFQGDYTEINLLLISFWSFSGEDNAGGPGETSGSGLTFLFGLFINGTLEDSQGTQYSFSGVFDQILTAGRATAAAAVTPLDPRRSPARI